MSYYQQTLAIDREIGSKGGIAGCLGNMANILDAMGDLSGARKMQEQSLAATAGARHGQRRASEIPGGLAVIRS